MIYFISDHHWGHKNIINSCNRPFDNVHDMNVYMINQWNSIINDDDEVYHLGDLSYKMSVNHLKTNVLDNLNGKIHLIKGNHDKDKIINKIKDRFETIQDYKILDYNYNDKLYKFVLFHYPIYSWYGKYRGSIHIHGHSHDKNNDINGNIINISVENINYKPMSIINIIEKINNKNTI